MFVAMSTRESTDKKVANFNYLKMHSLSIGSVVLTEQRERGSKNDQSYFTVLDSVTTKFQVKLNKESVYKMGKARSESTGQTHEFDK